MKLIVKKLQGGECNIEVENTLQVHELKKALEDHLSVPTAAQTLVFMGKTLTDECSLEAAGLKEGSKLHLITRRTDANKPATASKPSESSSSVDPPTEDVFTQLSKILNKHLTPQQSERVLAEFKKNCTQLIDSMNLEDIQRFVDSDFTEF